MINPNHTQNPAIPQICSQLPSLLPLIFFITLTAPSYYPDLLPYIDPNTLHVINMYVPFLSRVKIVYCCKKHDKKDATKRQGSISPHALIRTINFIVVVGFQGLIQRQGLASLENQHYKT